MTGNFCHQRWLLLLNWTSVLKDVYRNRSLLAWVRLPRTQFSTCSSWKPVTGYNYSIVHVPIHQKNSKSYLYREATTHMTYTEIKFQYFINLSILITRVFCRNKLYVKKIKITFTFTNFSFKWTNPIFTFLYN